MAEGSLDRLPGSCQLRSRREKALFQHNGFCGLFDSLEESKAIVGRKSVSIAIELE